jgi:hypothetical protein
VQETGRRDAYFGWDLMHVRWLLAAQLAVKLSQDIMIRNGVLMCFTPSIEADARRWHGADLVSRVMTHEQWRS